MVIGVYFQVWWLTILLSLKIIIFPNSWNFIPTIYHLLFFYIINKHFIYNSYILFTFFIPWRYILIKGPYSHMCCTRDDFFYIQNIHITISWFFIVIWGKSLFLIPVEGFILLYIIPSKYLYLPLLRRWKSFRTL